MCYRCLPNFVFLDTLQLGVKSKQGNKYAQVYCTSYGWSRCCAMTKKSNAHGTLLLMFKRDGVPQRIIVDNSKEQSLSNFAHKFR